MSKKSNNNHHKATDATNDETPNEEVAATVVVETPDELIQRFGNKSNAIRALSAEGKTRSEVARLLGIRYQHVNNVLGQILKRVIKKERDDAMTLSQAANESEKPETTKGE